MINYRQTNPWILSIISILLLQFFSTSNSSNNQIFKRLSIVLFNSPALAQSLPADIQYSPPDRGAPRSTGSGGARLHDNQYSPPNRGVPSSTVGGGARAHEKPTILESEDNWTRTRGSSTAAPTTIPTVPKECTSTVPTLLVPQNHLGLTTSSNPTFLWYLPNKNIEVMMFEIRKAGEKEPIYAEQLQPSEGIIQLKLPKEKVTLDVGNEYIWSVSVPCISEGKRRKISVEAGIKVVAPTEELKIQLSQANTPQQKARVFAQKGYWYDALETLSNAYTANANQSTYADILSLLDQVGLSEITKKERQQ
ncbi:hypothetical protein NIES2119_00200 [[Phormidium ambiguum] IAM M-71]|uniref:DUF928 domain-containing protein n=1 Tax=[Phormidium ambiguum] IAM M-71 TaxID=454136 RepID=A0A1U7ITG8_9CYAN|nr:DUF928 domain-containing protein [Phormidium ambiguum]OKH40775.1 hypothetical protein NIES2119_00200 [Phormidium ambiguum IAM M-71]